MIRTCSADPVTYVHHIADVPPCCPVSGNPRPGSTIAVRYRPAAGLVLPVEDLSAMVGQYVGGFGAVRAQEEMIQSIAARCAALVKVSVRVRADLVITPPDGGDDQRMVVTCRATPHPHSSALQRPCGTAKW